MQTKLIFCFLAVVLLAGCRKSPLNELTDDEQRIYITNYDRAANFGAFKTFSIADQVLTVEGGSSQQRTPTAADAALMEALSAALQSRGFVPVAKSATPNLGVQLSRIVRTSTGLVTVGDYWGMWDPTFWGGPGYGWGGGGFGWGSPAWGVAQYQVREGMLAVDVVDLKNAGANNNLRVLWNSLVRGPGLTSTTTAGVIASQLIEQSPYLKTN